MEENFERPCLGCQPCSDNLPMVLSSSPLIQVPASMAQYLRDYQREGVRFLYQRYQATQGGILADDMGLGKTIQTIAFVAAILKMTGTKLDQLRHVTDFIRQDVAPDFTVPSFEAVLIICPASLTDNWMQEFITWGYFKVLKFTTSNRLEVINKAKHQNCDVVIATYEAARSYVDLLNSVQWSSVFVDEVHRIKDVNSQTTKALCSIRNKYRFGLTGTPFQNNLKELWCILNWANPGCMGPFSVFSNDVIKVIEVGQKQKATKRECVDARTARLTLATKRRKYMLRRKKDLLAKHLPLKTDQIVFCNLTPLQEKIYLAFVQSPNIQMLLGQLNNNDSTKCNNSGWISSNSVTHSKTKAGLLFTYMHLLQKTANHPALLISPTATASSDIAYETCLDVFGSSSINKNVNSSKEMIKALAAEEMSGKMQVLLQLTAVFLERGDKILVFSYSTKLLDLIEKQFIQKKYRYSRLDGSTPADSRYDLVRAFNTSPHSSVFLISTKAGGVGLNITGANIVIIYDPNWNPAHDLQAQDRAYRLGQQRDVHVYRLLSVATIEEFIYLRQLYKQQLASASTSSANVVRYFNSVPGDPRYYGELFGIKNIFSYHQNRRSLTEEILNRQENIELDLQNKFKPPLRDETCGAKVVPCLLKSDGENDRTSGIQSGLKDLCREVLGFCDEDFCVDKSDSDTSIKDSEDEEQTEEDSVEDNVSNILQSTAVVRNIVDHDDIIAPSRAEELMEACAVRDVLQKQRNSQLPAFVCSSESQGVPAQLDLVEATASSSDYLWMIRRMCFTSFAKKEYLTSYELGVKVLSMSAVEKQHLLNKHQKKKLSLCPALESSCLDTSSLKQNPPLVLPKVSEDIFDQHVQSDVEQLSEDLGQARKRVSSEISTSFHDVLDNASEEIPTKVLLLENPEKIDLNDASKHDQNFLSKDKSSKGLTNICTENQSVFMKSSFPTTSGGAKTSAVKSCFISKENAAILDSLFLSNCERKPSPKKKFEDSKQFLLSGKSNSTAPSDYSADTLDKPLKKAVSNDIKDLMNEVFFNGTLNKEKEQRVSESPDVQEYNWDDDVFNKLFKSGKLKIV